MHFVRRVNDRGTLTLPSEIREALGVEDGDIVEFEVVGIVKKRIEATAPPAKDSAKATATASRAKNPAGGVHA